ncbi:hypothetical protein BASA50_004552 [Batrachochytrium salamandrivorans]|uniref:Uncharacterized protein n=1 Tax=Batrachochytrium salamandrivorans TaxID=1357716 RepID=A0ABQ8FEZ9_9FUNG|nr:hypothetical protein BASA50_004552 [Batrachochytrium salamandrivorans]
MSSIHKDKEEALRRRLEEFKQKAACLPSSILPSPGQYRSLPSASSNTKTSNTKTPNNSTTRQRPSASDHLSQSSKGKPSSNTRDVRQKPLQSQTLPKTPALSYAQLMRLAKANEDAATKPQLEPKRSDSRHSTARPSSKASVAHAQLPSRSTHVSSSSSSAPPPSSSKQSASLSQPHSKSHSQSNPQSRPSSSHLRTASTKTSNASFSSNKREDSWPESRRPQTRPPIHTHHPVLQQHSQKPQQQHPQQQHPQQHMTSPSRSMPSSSAARPSPLTARKSLLKSTVRALSGARQSKSRPPPPSDLIALQRTTPRPKDTEAAMDEMRQRKLQRIAAASTKPSVSEKYSRPYTTAHTITAPPIRRSLPSQTDSNTLQRSHSTTTAPSSSKTPQSRSKMLDRREEPSHGTVSNKRQRRLSEGSLSPSSSPPPTPEYIGNHDDTTIPKKKPAHSLKRQSNESHTSPQASRRKKYNLDEAILDDEFVRKNTSDIIQQIFKRGNRSPPRRYYSDSGTESDMEADYSTLAQEETKSARIARKEDDEEELRQIEAERRLAARRRRSDS